MGQRVEARHQRSQQPVGALDAAPHVRMIGAEPVAGAVDEREIERDQVRAFGRRQSQPGQNLLDPLAVGDAAVVRPPVAGPHAADVGLRAGEEEGGRDQSLVLRGDPDRLAAPPASVLRVFAPAVAELRAAHRIEEPVPDDAVRFRMQAGGNRVVSGEGQRRKDADEAGRTHPARREAVEVRRVEAVEVTGVKAVERDEDDMRARRGGGMVDSAGSGRRLRRRGRTLALGRRPGAAGDRRHGDEEKPSRARTAPQDSRPVTGGVSDGA